MNPAPLSALDLEKVRRDIQLLIAGLGPGEELVYYRGLLAVARHRMVQKTVPHPTYPNLTTKQWVLENVEPLNTVAAVFEQAATEGRVILYQRKEGPGVAEYIARRPIPTTATTETRAFEAEPV